MDPHMNVDNNGVIHAVWASTYPMPQYPCTLILYAKSSDQGTTWSSPEILIDDTNSWIVETHIVCDSQNHLYVSYDHNVQVPEIATVNLIIFDGVNWSEPITVSNQPGCFKNRLVVDQTDRVYCFWDGWDSGNDNIFYRYLENGIWSDVIKPYNGNGDFYFLNNITVDKLSNLHGVGYYSNTGNYYSNTDDVYYFYYNKSTNQWAPKEKIDNSPGRAWNGCDVSVDTMNVPHFVWGEFFPLSDSIQNFTSYLYPNESGWLPIDTVEKDHSAAEYRLLLDNQNIESIIVRYKNDKYENYELVHYKKYYGYWVGEIIDSISGAWFYPNIEMINNETLGLIYFKGHIFTDSVRDVYFTKYNIFTGFKPYLIPETQILISPNPLINKTNITYSLVSSCRVVLDIIDINGRLINRITDQTQSPGRYCYTWQGKSLNGKEVNSGVYFVRLQAGRCVYSRRVIKL